MLLATVLVLTCLLSSAVMAAPASVSEEEDPLETSETGHFRRKRVWRKLLKQFSGLGGYGLGGYGLGGYGLGGYGLGSGLGGYALDYLLQGLGGPPGPSHHHHGGYGYHAGYHGAKPPPPPPLVANPYHGSTSIGYGGVHHGPAALSHDVPHSGLPLIVDHSGSDLSPWGNYWGVPDTYGYGWGGHHDLFLDNFIL